MTIFFHPLYSRPSCPHGRGVAILFARKVCYLHLSRVGLTATECHVAHKRIPWFNIERKSSPQISCGKYYATKSFHEKTNDYWHIFGDNNQVPLFQNVSNKLGEKDSYLVISTLDVRINTTADVTCRSCNEIDCVNSTRQILVSGNCLIVYWVDWWFFHTNVWYIYALTDVSGHFAIIDPGLVAEGDDINITCAATGYNFTDTITWSLEDPKKQGMPIFSRDENMVSIR